MLSKRFCVRWLLSLLAAEGVVSCTAVNTDYAPLDGVPYASITDPVTGKNLSDVAYAPVRDGIPYYLPRSLIELAITMDPKTKIPVISKAINQGLSRALLKMAKRCC